MNVGLHQFAQGGVDLSMACNQGLALKRFGDDVHGEVATPGGRSGMAGVQMAVILDIDVLRLEGLLQGAANPVDAIHGMVLMKGWTSMCE